MLSYPPIVSVLETTTGVSTSLSPYKIAGRGNQAIASDGSVLVVDSSSRTLSLWQSGAVRTIDQRTTAQGSISAAHISANGSVGVSTFWLGNDAYQLVSHDMSSGRSILLGRTLGTEPSLSADGSLVAYLDKAPDGTVQAYLQRTDGTARRVLTAENRNVSEVVVSGFGNVVYAIGARGRLLRIDTGTFAVTEVVKVPPSISPFSTVPGSLFSVSREILYPGTTGVSINGRAAPLVASNDSRLTFQVPWETATEKFAFFSTSGIETPFENATQSQVVTSVPTFSFLDTARFDSPGYVLALHEDFGSVVNPQNPSSPGGNCPCFPDRIRPGNSLDCDGCGNSIRPVISGYSKGELPSGFKLQ